MQTEDAKVVNDVRGVFVSLPLTKPTGKIRIKRRSVFHEYGLPVRPRQDALTQANDVEWQIGYDLLPEESNRSKTSLGTRTFTNYKGETKFGGSRSKAASAGAYNGPWNFRPWSTRRPIYRTFSARS